MAGIGIIVQLIGREYNFILSDLFLTLSMGLLIGASITIAALSLFGILFGNLTPKESKSAKRWLMIGVVMATGMIILSLYIINPYLLARSFGGLMKRSLMCACIVDILTFFIFYKPIVENKKPYKTIE
ncbi:MAG: hypothetical protein ABEI53_02530 [Candidatus Magasanikbacteria bacterium]